VARVLAGDTDRGGLDPVWRQWCADQAGQRRN
jgi:hypothetical protein